MAKYRKKPVVIEAVQFTGANWAEIQAFAGMDVQLDDIAVLLKIPTLEGVMQADKGDWIIRGIKGELYPCKPDIFAATYEFAG